MEIEYLPTRSSRGRGSVWLNTYLKQEKVPNMAPAAIPTANPIINPIFTLSKQPGWACP